MWYEPATAGRASGPPAARSLRPVRARIRGPARSGPPRAPRPPRAGSAPPPSSRGRTAPRARRPRAQAAVDRAVGPDHLDLEPRDAPVADLVERVVVGHGHEVHAAALGQRVDL